MCVFICMHISMYICAYVYVFLELIIKPNKNCKTNEIKFKKNTSRRYISYIISLFTFAFEIFIPTMTSLTKLALIFTILNQV